MKHVRKGEEAVGRVTREFHRKEGNNARQRRSTVHAERKARGFCSSGQGMFHCSIKAPEMMTDGNEGGNITATISATTKDRRQDIRDLKQKNMFKPQHACIHTKEHARASGTSPSMRQSAPWRLGSVARFAFAELREEETSEEVEERN